MSIRSLSIAGTGMVAMQHLVDVIANNIANSNTTSYKTSKASFQDLIYQTEVRMGALAAESGERIPTGVQFGLGVTIGAVYKNFEQGALTATPSTPLNVAIDGKGFFIVTLPNGETAYTRDGTFQKNAEGQVVTAQGYEISPGITIPNNATNITITSDGKVQVTIPSQVDPQEIGQLELTVFNNPAGLEAIGGNLYKETASSGEAIVGNPLEDGFGEIKQHFLEDSNVNSIEEISNLIKAQRNYEMNSKVIQTTEQMLKTATDAKA